MGRFVSARAFLLGAALLSAMFSSHCMAGGMTGWSKISLLYVNNNWTDVGMQSMTDNPDGCASVAYYALVPSDPNYATLHATLMAAQFAGKYVSFYISGCATSNNYPHILSVVVRTD